ncbi:MAG: alpha/beta fold hydrolase [Blastocatellia bacterium]|nr:alpha/beta fold hydrolase [Blastocatellia bacterium]
MKMWRKESTKRTKITKQTKFSLFFSFVSLFSFVSYFLFSPSTAFSGQSGIDLKPCRLPEVIGEAKCGRYQVYEDRVAQRGRRIDLKVVVLPALTARRAPDALFVLAGNPGQAATDLSGFSARVFAGVRQERDIVLVDQRGTGESNGLSCDLYGESLQGQLGDLLPLEAIKACSARWDQRADLRFYTTPLAMDDLDDVRAALGYERINFFATAYGTRAAQVYLRHYPERVRSMILRGTMPVSELILPAIARDAQRSLDLVIEDCGKNAGCRKAYPNLKREVSEVIARFEKGGVAVQIANDETGKVERGELSRGAFITTLCSLLQSPGTIARLPMLINEAYKGNYSPFTREVLMIRRGFSRSTSIGAFLSVINSEDMRLIDTDRSEGTFMGDYYYQQLRQACALLPQGTLPPGYREPAVSSAPVLLISDRFDPATPPHYAELVAENLRNSRHLILSGGGGHSSSGLPACLDSLMNEFIIRADLKELDSSCLERSAPISYLVGRA